jgi:flagellar basal-body rod protein FlgF
MDNAGTVALSRMIVQQNVLDTRASNIANMSTPGFKAGGVLFSDFLVDEAGDTTIPGGQTEQMVQDRATWRDFSQGPLSRTGNPLDFALNGSGFFVIDTSRGERYTRAGRFALSASSQIVDMEGNTVQGTDGRPLTVPIGDTNITVASDGTISTESGQLGKIRVVTFDSQQSLQAEGNCLFSTTETPQDAGQPGVVQGAFEGSNVQAVVELTRMMAEMREFDFASQFVDAESQRSQNAIDHILHPSS